MNRKFLAGFLAASLVLTAAPVVPGMEVNADAEELSIGSQTGGGYLDLIGSSRAATQSAIIEETITCEKFFSAHSKGFPVTEEGLEITFKSRSNGDKNWDAPIVVAYTGSGDAPEIGGSGYVEYAVIRSDNFALDGVNKPEDFVFTGAENINWDTWRASNRSEDGANCKVSAVKKDGKIYIEFTNDSITSLSSFTPSGEGEVYIGITGENCVFGNTLPELEEPDDTTTPPTDETDDPTPPPSTDDPTDPPITGDAEILTGTAWWDGLQRGKDYPLKGDGTLDLFIGYIGGLDGGAFNVELVSDGKKYITTGSDINIWTAEDATGVVGGGTEGMASIAAGHKYKVSVTRQGQDFTIIYFDMTDNKEHCKLTATGTNMGEDVNIHVMAQIGKYMVSTSDFDMPDVNVTTPKPLAPYPVVLPTPEPLPTLPPADENATPEPTPVLEPETITGTEWWAATNGRSRDYVLKGAGTLDLYVTFDSTSDSTGYGAFNVELVSDGNKYITTGSDINAWTAEEGKGTISGAVNTGSTIIPGHVYKITVKRTNYDFTITYYDLTDNKEYCTMEVKDTNQGIDVNVHVMAQVGKYIVSQKAPDVVAPSESATPAPSADPEASPDPSETTDPGNTETPGTTDPGTNPGDKDPGTDNPAEDPSDDDNDDKETKKTMKVSDITAKAGKKKITGKLSVKGTKVTVKVGSKKAKNAKVSGKKFTFTVSSKLKKGTKVTIKVTKSGYKAVTKTVKVK
ncbi:MAG: hypothetical protein K2O92_01710 [Lachnospiraceae bacterium]|nr:hypothetical protein [Lachnospiraceae bacterium]